MVAIRVAEPADFDRIRAFCRAVGYTGEVGADDRVVLAEVGEQLVGLLRLAREGGVVVLRGMRVASDRQRQGIGAQLLAVVDRLLGADGCYCIAYDHLGDFYGRIGFRDLDPARAPRFLVNRLHDYQARRPERFRLLARAAGGPPGVARDGQT